jgi:hypothetical protein
VGRAQHHFADRDADAPDAEVEGEH